MRVNQNLFRRTHVYEQVNVDKLADG